MVRSPGREQKDAINTSMMFFFVVMVRGMRGLGIWSYSAVDSDYPFNEALAAAVTLPDELRKIVNVVIAQKDKMG